MFASNYDITRQKMEQHFPDYDRQKMIDRYGLAYDENYLYLTFFYCPYRVNRTTGKVQRRRGEGWQDGEYNDSMTIFDALCKDNYAGFLTGSYVTIRQLPGAAHSGLLGVRFLDKWALNFQGKAPQLDRALAALGAKKQTIGDVSYEIMLFDFLPAVIQFWEGDEEFPPSLAFLWDKNTIDFLHYETLYYAMGHVVEVLTAMCESREN